MEIRRHRYAINYKIGVILEKYLDVTEIITIFNYCGIKFQKLGFNCEYNESDNYFIAKKLGTITYPVLIDIIIDYLDPGITRYTYTSSYRGSKNNMYCCRCRKSYNSEEYDNCPTPPCKKWWLLYSEIMGL